MKSGTAAYIEAQGMILTMLFVWALTVKLLKGWKCWHYVLYWLAAYLVVMFLLIPEMLTVLCGLPVEVTNNID